VTGDAGTDPLRRPIFHLALASDWEAALAGGHYRISTRGATIEQVGYLHAAFAEQVAGVAARYYADVTEPLLLLTIDPSLVGPPIVVEPAAPGTDALFPHVYGPLAVDAVIAVSPVTRDATGRPALP
jgi:glutathione S-transferase